ncbi:WD repeat and SOCS box-containing protein 2 [Manis javanica]|nr:WD repeat and SOCS box-containing protein 2 [Manis javanica]
MTPTESLRPGRNEDVRRYWKKEESKSCNTGALLWRPSAWSPGPCVQKTVLWPYLFLQDLEKFIKDMFQSNHTGLLPKPVRDGWMDGCGKEMQRAVSQLLKSQALESESQRLEAI